VHCGPKAEFVELCADVWTDNAPYTECHCNKRNSAGKPQRLGHFVGILKRLMDKLLHGWWLGLLNQHVRLVYVAMAKTINYHRRCVNNY
jgi:hypothetical protein